MLFKFIKTKLNKDIQIQNINLDIHLFLLTRILFPIYLKSS